MLRRVIYRNCLVKEYSVIYVRGKMVFTTSVHKNLKKKDAGPKNVQSVRVQVYVKRVIYVQKKVAFKKGEVPSSERQGLERLWSRAGTSIASGERLSLQLSLLRVDIVGR